jgi:acetolactate synthase-1/2/3 large subunit
MEVAVGGTTWRGTAGRWRSRSAPARDQEMFTLSGGHVFPLYDGAVKGDPPLRLVDVRHEQTAVFAAEADGQAAAASRAGGADGRDRG